MAAGKFVGAIDDILTAGRKIRSKAGAVIEDVVTGTGKETVSKVADLANAAKEAGHNQLYRPRAQKLASRQLDDEAKLANVSLSETIYSRGRFNQASIEKLAIRSRPIKRVDPSLTNAYTGYEMKRGWDIGLAAGALSFGVGVSAVQANTVDTKVVARSEQAGTLQGLSYDAVPNAAGNRRDLGATGDLVFGLHNQRRG